MSDKNQNPSNRMYPTKEEPTKSNGQKVHNIDPMEHRVHPVENGADPSDARKADRDAEEYNK